MKVSILMCTYNGEQYIREQLKSISAQTFNNWDIWISDDGSTDKTVNICKEYKKKETHKVYLREGPRSGFAMNFMSILANCDNTSDFYAFADQDDIWLPEKLKVAVDAIMSQSENIPVLYCSRTELVDKNGREFKPKQYSNLRNDSPSFRNALVQSIASGNTMVMNRSAKRLVMKFKLNGKIPSHDWWFYQVVTGAGGVVIYDKTTSLLYRQHGKNLIGDNGGILAKLKRGMMFINGEYRQSNERNLRNLEKNKNLLIPINKHCLEKFLMARQKGLVGLVDLYKSGAGREGWTNLIVWLGCVIGKI